MGVKESPPAELPGTPAHPTRSGASSSELAPHLLVVFLRRAEAILEGSGVSILFEGTFFGRLLLLLLFLSFFRETKRKTDAFFSGGGPLRKETPTSFCGSVPILGLV